MLGRCVGEISIDNMNWPQAAELTKILVENGYAVMTTVEERLIIINYLCAEDEGCEEANRNNVAFMSREEFDGDYVRCGEEEEE